MLDNPIKFSSSLSSSEDDLPAHQSFEEDVSSDDWRPSDYSPPWSSKKEDDEDKDEDDADANSKDDNDDSNSDDSNFTSPPPKQARRA
jgi:hypothetical protein